MDAGQDQRAGEVQTIFSVDHKGQGSHPRLSARLSKYKSDQSP